MSSLAKLFMGFAILGLMACASKVSRQPAATFSPSTSSYTIGKDLAPYLSFDMAGVAEDALISGVFEWNGGDDVTVRVLAPARAPTRDSMFRYYDSPDGNTNRKYDSFLSDMMTKANAKNYKIVSLEKQTRGQIFGGLLAAAAHSFGVTRQPDSFIHLAWDIDPADYLKLAGNEKFSYRGRGDESVGDLNVQSKLNCGLTLDVRKNDKGQQTIRFGAYGSLEGKWNSSTLDTFTAQDGRWISPSGNTLEISKDGIHYSTITGWLTADVSNAPAKLSSRATHDPQTEHFVMVYHPYDSGQGSGAMSAQCIISGNAVGTDGGGSLKLSDFLAALP
jgi:hypothetical protein